MEILSAKSEDISGWITLVKKIKDDFPGLETEQGLAEHEKTVLNFIERNEAVCAKENGIITGVLLFSNELSELCFLAVDPEYRRKHTAEKMLNFMLELMDGKEISVSTYCEGVPEGAAARAFYKRMGFTEGEISEEFGSPVQIFRLK